MMCRGAFLAAFLSLVFACALARAETGAAGTTEAAAVAASAAAALTPEGDETPKPKIEATPKTICSLIEASAASHRLPIDFFTRLIWKESSFRSAAVSPKGAQGIAQFMPGTAALRGLGDPFDPEEAIPASARYLKDLSERFGNLGLAAAAYNAGEKRVSNWLAGTGGLPWETQDYVLSITGRTAEEWTQPDPNLVAGLIVGRLPLKRSAPPSCLELAALLARPGAGSEPVMSILKAPWAPWGIQVAGNFSLNRAMASFANVQKRHSRILGSGPPMVVRSVMRGRGRAPLFQVRVPAQSREEAAGICGRLQAAGGACVVLKN